MKPRVRSRSSGLVRSADVGEIPPGECLVEVPIEVLRFAAQHEGWAES